MSRRSTVVLLLGPNRTAVSGVSTHLNLLFGSRLSQDFSLRHFQVGSEGHREGLPGFIVRLLLSPLTLAITILWTNVDVVHINTSINRRAFWRDLAYMAVARACGCRVLYQVHGGALPQEFCASSRLMNWLLRASLSMPHVIVVLAKCELEAYRSFMPKLSILIVPNALDTAPFKPVPAVALRSSMPLRLLYIGRLSRSKGLYESLQALVIARAQACEVSLFIAGAGPDEMPLRRMVDELGLADAVTIVGPVFDAAKYSLLANADILLLPTYAEGLPYALLEGMAAGLPAITTRVGAIPDVVIEGLHGVFVAPGDAVAIGRAILHLAANREMIARMGAACRDRIASHYTIDKLTDAFGKLYVDCGTAADTRSVTVP